MDTPRASTLPAEESADSQGTLCGGLDQWDDNLTLDTLTPVYVGAAPEKQRTILRPDHLSHPVTNEIYYFEDRLAGGWRLDQLWLQLVSGIE